MKEKPLYNVITELEQEVKVEFGKVFSETMREILAEENINENHEEESSEEDSSEEDN